MQHHPDKPAPWLDRATEIILVLAAMCAAELLIAHLGRYLGWWTLG